MERVTLQHTTDGETTSVEDTKPVDRLAGIVRTRGLEAASRSQQRRNPISVKGNERQANGFHITFQENSVDLGAEALHAMCS
jgi:5-enolpyruvylshikimate-3-phosphate synthase